jgi:hypothetical protein
MLQNPQTGVLLTRTSEEVMSVDRDGTNVRLLVTASFCSGVLGVIQGMLWSPMNQRLYVLCLAQAVGYLSQIYEVDLADAPVSSSASQWTALATPSNRVTLQLSVDMTEITLCGLNRLVHSINATHTHSSARVLLITASENLACGAAVRRLEWRITHWSRWNSWIRSPPLRR